MKRRRQQPERWYPRSYGIASECAKEFKALKPEQTVVLLIRANVPQESEFECPSCYTPQFIGTSVGITESAIGEMAPAVPSIEPGSLGMCSLCGSFFRWNELLCLEVLTEDHLQQLAPTLRELLRLARESFFQLKQLH